MNPDDNQDQDQQGQDQSQPTPNPTQDEPVQPLPQDGDTPFSEPSDVPDSDIPADNPQLDTGVQQEEVYDEGSGGPVEDNKPAEDTEEPERLA